MKIFMFNWFAEISKNFGFLSDLCKPVYNGNQIFELNRTQKLLKSNRQFSYNLANEKKLMKFLKSQKISDSLLSTLPNILME